LGEALGDGVIEIKEVGLGFSVALSLRERRADC